MAPPLSQVVFPTVARTTREQDETGDDLHELDFLAIGGEPGEMVKKESPQMEKQISVDPISLSLREPSFNLMLHPVITSPRDAAVPLPPLLPPAKPKFISCSLPGSATSSPRFGSILSKKKWKNESQASPLQVDNLIRQHSSTHSRLSLLQDSMLGKSKSCGEGRANAPSDEFDLCFNKYKAIEYSKMSHGSFSRAETNKDSYQTDKNIDPLEEEFKCGALCLFLPGFGKAKPVRPRKEEVVMENIISRTVSLEKFECGSWASSAIVQEHEDDGESTNHLYFDLPLELIKNNVNDAHAPINAAFVFDKELKGVLKNGSTSTRTSARKSHESSRHVRFSVSSPSTSYPASPASCITPRLRKAREDFNAFLEAQSA